MKLMKAWVVFAVALFGTAAGWAQTIEFITVTRLADYEQTGPSTVSAAATAPFKFIAEVEGNDSTTSTNPLTAATYTPPGGSVTSLTYDTDGHAWRFQDSTQTSMANLNAAYGTGSYAFNLTGTPSGASSITVGSFASTLLEIPQLTLSGGSWVGSTYQLTSAATLTISFNAVYSGSPGGTAAFHYDAELNGTSYNTSADAFINYDPTTLAAAPYASTPPNFVASSLAAGNYTFSASYVDIQNFGTLYGSVFGASLLEYRTSISVQVIPEPSTCAAILGALALAGVTVHRRRRAA
jgi:MYXO-CTERM domain-containing protein